MRTKFPLITLSAVILFFALALIGLSFLSKMELKNIKANTTAQVEYYFKVSHLIAYTHLEMYETRNARNNILSKNGDYDSNFYDFENSIEAVLKVFNYYQDTLKLYRESDKIEPKLAHKFSELYGLFDQWQKDEKALLALNASSQNIDAARQKADKTFSHVRHILYIIDNMLKEEATELTLQTTTSIEKAENTLFTTIICLAFAAILAFFIPLTLTISRNTTSLNRDP